MGKVTIYLPDALEQRVRAAELQVSTICQQALEQELLIVDARAALTTDLGETLERFRADVQRVDEEKTAEYQEGYALGVLWAREQTGFAELKELHETTRSADWSEFLVREKQSLYAFLEAQGVVDRPGIDRHTSPDSPGWFQLRRTPFTDGIVAGAHSVFQAVQDFLPETPREGS